MKILQGCNRLVTNMKLWSQGSNELVKLLHGCDEVVAKVVTRLQGLYNLATTLSFLYGTKTGYLSELSLAWIDFSQLLSECLSQKMSQNFLFQLRTNGDKSCMN